MSDPEIAVVRLARGEATASIGAAVNEAVRAARASVVLLVSQGVELDSDSPQRHQAAHAASAGAALVVERCGAPRESPFGRYLAARVNSPLRWAPIVSLHRADFLALGECADDSRLDAVLLIDLEWRARRRLDVIEISGGSSTAPQLTSLHAACERASTMGAALPALYERDPSTVAISDVGTLLACPAETASLPQRIDDLVAAERAWLRGTIEDQSLGDAALEALTAGWHDVITRSLATGAQRAWPEAAAIRRALPRTTAGHGAAPSVQLGNPRRAHGLRTVVADAITEPVVVAGRAAEQIRRGPGGARVLYAALDHRPTNDAQPIAIDVEYLDSGRCVWTIEYDSRDAAVCFPPERPGAFKSATPPVAHTDSGVWRTARFILDDWRFERSCHGADFRVVVAGDAADDPILQSISVVPASIGDEAGSSTPVDAGLVSLAAAEAPVVSIVIPVRDRLEYTAACLRAIAGSTRLPIEIIVVDNGSTDGTGAFLDRCDGIRHLARAENGGFAIACNEGADAARGEVLVFLNNDTLPVAGWLDALNGALTSRPHVAIAGAKLLFATQEARVQHAGMWFDGFQAVHRHLFAPAADPAASTSGVVPAVTGACFAIRRDEFIAVGGFDSGFLNGYEDVDLCLRLLERGRSTYYCAESVVFHHGGVSAGRFTREAENRARFLARWGPSLPALLHAARLHG